MNNQLTAAAAILALGMGIAAEALAQANPNQLIAQRKGSGYFSLRSGSSPIHRRPRRSIGAPIW